MMDWLRRYVLPHPDWWMNKSYGSGIEGLIRQHIPAHVGQGFLLYWYFHFSLRWVVKEILDIVGWVLSEFNVVVELANLPPLPWMLAAWFAISACAVWEALQRERWRRDATGEVTMAMKENVWDVILGAGGIGAARLVHLLF